MLAVCFLFEHFDDAINESVNPCEDEKQLNELQRARVVMQISQGHLKQLRDYYEVYQILDVVYVQVRDETLHLQI